MSGLFTINVSEARGTVAVPANLDQLAIVIGCSSQGSGLSPFFLSGAAAIANRGAGDAVDTLCQIIEQKQSNGNAVGKVPCAMYTTPVTTDGSYGAIDVSGVTGACAVAVDSTVHPYGTYEARLRVVAGGNIGTSGITIQESLDGGHNYSNTKALGTATSWTIASGNAKFKFGAVVTGTTDATASGLYGGSSTLDGETLILTQPGGSPSTLNLDKTTNAASEAALLAAIEAEWPLITATVVSTHLVLTAVGGPIVIGAGTANTHLGLSAGTVNGTLVAGDVVACRTFAPAPSVDDIDAAFAALASATVDFSIVCLDFDCTAAIASHVTSGLNALLAVGKRCVALIRTRIPMFESSEDDATWSTAIATDFANYTDSRVVKRATYELVTDAMTTREYLRSDFAQFCADVVRTPRAQLPAVPADPVTGLSGMSNVSLVDATGATVGHDEGPRGASTGLSDPALGNTFSCVQRFPDPSTRESVFNTVPWTSFAADDTMTNLPSRRLGNAVERTIVAAGIPKLGSGPQYFTSTGPSSGILTETARNAIQGSIYQAVKSEFAGEIGNADDASIDTGLIQVSPNVTVSNKNLLSVSVTGAPQFGGYVLNLNVTLAVQF